MFRILSNLLQWADFAPSFAIFTTEQLCFSILCNTKQLSLFLSGILAPFWALVTTG
jgi:hypothetical protein